MSNIELKMSELLNKTPVENISILIERELTPGSLRDWCVLLDEEVGQQNKLNRYLTTIDSKIITEHTEISIFIDLITIKIYKKMLSRVKDSPKQ